MQTLICPDKYKNWIPETSFGLRTFPNRYSKVHELFPCTFLVEDEEDFNFALWLVENLKACELYIDPAVSYYNNQSIPEQFPLPALYIADGKVTGLTDTTGRPGKYLAPEFFSTRSVFEFFESQVQKWVEDISILFAENYTQVFKEYGNRYIRRLYLHQSENNLEIPKLR